MNRCVVCVSAKEEEKLKLMKWSSELKLEREQLELRVKQLSNSVTVRNKHIQSPSLRDMLTRGEHIF